MPVSLSLKTANLCMLTIAFSGWPRFKKEHFQGPFEGNTSHPILLIGNTAGEIVLP